jgi:dolichyl-phosphate-mannose--protein O-mannosyl transferase
MVRSARVPPEFWLLCAAALITRFWSLTSPGELVWDERHYAYFIGSYLNRSWMMDVHPPLGRMLLAVVAWLEGYGRELMSQQVGAPWVRVLPALAGAALVPGVWGIVRALGGGRPAAALAATAVLADLGLLVQSRIILPDTLLLLAILGSVACTLASERAAAPQTRILWLLGAAIAAGAAVSIKWTGLSAAGLVGARLAYATWRRTLRPREALLHGAVALLVVAGVYLGSFAVQLRLLREAGREDVWMSPAFTRTLEGAANQEHGSTIPFLVAVKEVHQVMGRMNASIAEQGGGASSSPWYTWPISKHAITLQSKRSDQAEGQQWIVMTGNPLVWYSVFVGMLVVCAALGAAHLRRWRDAAWAADLRPMYLYHYFAALLFSVMFAALGVDVLTRHGGRAGVVVRVSWITVMIAAAAYLAPIAYGWPLSAQAVRHRFALLERPGVD